MKFSADLEIGKLLNLFIANEYFAWKQYFMAKVVANGKALKYANSVFSDNGNEELDEHFKELVDYAQSINVDVEINPKQMCDNTSAPYIDLDSVESTKDLVKILIDAEKQAIDEYEDASDGNAAKDYPSLRLMFAEMAKDERLHLKELEDLMSNIDSESEMKTKSNKKETSDKNAEDKDSEEKTVDDDSENEDKDEKDDVENEKSSERKIGKDFDLSKDFKKSSSNTTKDEKKSKDEEDEEDDDNDSKVNESIVGSYLSCEQMLFEAFN